MTKKQTSLRVEPDVLKKLKYWGWKYDKPLGDVLEALVKFTESSKCVNDKEFQKRFDHLLEISFKKVPYGGNDALS